jgi:hypothetical protein
MKRYFLSAILISVFFILSACQQNAERVSTAAPTTNITASSTKTTTPTLLPTFTSSEIVCVTSTPYPIPDVNLAQAVPEILKKGSIQGRLILNRDYTCAYDKNCTSSDRTTMLHLSNYQEVDLKHLTGFSYHWGGGIAYPNSYSPNYENYVWSTDGNLIAVPCQPIFNKSHLCILEADSIKNEELSVESFILVDPDKNEYAGYGAIRSITWAPNNEQLITEVNDIPDNPCLIDRLTKEVICGARKIFSNFSETDQQILAKATNISWSPVDKNQLAFSFRGNTTKHPSGIYLADLENKTLEMLWKLPDGLLFAGILWNQNADNITFSTYEGQKSKEIFEYGVKPNRTIRTINVHNKNTNELFSATDIYLQIAGEISEKYRDSLPQIYLVSWSPDEQYLLVETICTSNDDKQRILGIFAYHIETNKLYKIRDFVELSTMPFRSHRLYPAWTP